MKQDSRVVTARVRVRCEVTSVTHLELIVNGKIRAESVPSDKQRGAWWEFETQIELSESSWIAARAYSTTPGGQPDAEAHTNPIYVYFEMDDPTMLRIRKAINQGTIKQPENGPYPFMSL